MEAGFGGHLNVFELTKAMIEAGAAGVHLEDQLASEKKCGHMGGKVLLPTSWAIRNLVAARLAADVSGVPTMIIARTDADAADMLISDADERDHEFLTGERTAEGFFRTNAGIEQAIARGIAYAPYADLVWCETSEPDMEQAERFARELHDAHPGKLLAYNCSPSFNWKGKLDDDEIACFQSKLGELGYAFQFITLAGFHTLNHSMFELARGYREHGMTAYAELQQAEFANEDAGYTAVKHQHEVGASYFEEVAMAITGGESETTSVEGLDRGVAVQPLVARAVTAPVKEVASQRASRFIRIFGMKSTRESSYCRFPAVERLAVRRTSDFVWPRPTRSCARACSLGARRSPADQGVAASCADQCRLTRANASAMSSGSSSKSGANWMRPRNAP